MFVWTGTTTRSKVTRDGSALNWPVYLLLPYFHLCSGQTNLLAVTSTVAYFLAEKEGKHKQADKHHHKGETSIK